jgi:hypothetical protein
VDRNLYGAVLRNDGTTGRSYALTNHHEYFAELTEAYFGTNDFFPFRRSELQAHDPVGFEVLRAAWETRPPEIEEPIALASDPALGAAAKANCAPARAHRSRDSTTPARFVLRNTTSEPVQVVWLDFQGNRRAYARVEPGGLHIQKTFLLHPWLLADINGKCLAVVMPKKDGSYVSLAP